MKRYSALFSIVACAVSAGWFASNLHAAERQPHADYVPAASAQARRQLLTDGEAALRRGDAAQAADRFERAAALAHTADAELGLIRALMQAGEYRHALAYAAHTAGVHPDETAGAALYAWLLHLGGQTRIAAVLLDRAREHAPNDLLLERTRTLLESALPDPGLVGASWRFAPYDTRPDAMPPSARTVASGVAIDDGRKVLTSAAALGGASRVRVRNGLGVSSAARVVRAHGDVAELELDEPLSGAGVSPAALAAYPGSPAFIVEFSTGSDAAPAWPVLRVGFLGRIESGDANVYALGIDVPEGPRGGPVFDASGRLIGIAAKGVDGRDELVSVARAGLGLQPAAHGIAKTAVIERPGLDEIYERALGVTVQVIVVR